VPHLFVYVKFVVFDYFTKFSILKAPYPCLIPSLRKIGGGVFDWVAKSLNAREGFWNESNLQSFGILSEVLNFPMLRAAILTSFRFTWLNGGGGLTSFSP